MIQMDKLKFNEMNSWQQLEECVKYYAKNHPRQREECRRLLKWLKVKKSELIFLVIQMDENDLNDIKKLLIGRKIVDVKPQYEHSIILLLDNGDRLEIDIDTGCKHGNWIIWGGNVGE